MGSPRSLKTRWARKQRNASDNPSSAGCPYSSSTSNTMASLVLCTIPCNRQHQPSAKSRPSTPSISTTLMPAATSLPPASRYRRRHQRTASRCFTAASTAALPSFKENSLSNQPLIFLLLVSGSSVNTEAAATTPSRH